MSRLVGWVMVFVVVAHIPIAIFWTGQWSGSRLAPPGHYEIDASELARSNEEQDRALAAAGSSLGYTYAYGFVGRDGGKITVSSDELHDLVEWGLQQKNQGCICLRAGVLHPSVDVIDGVFPGTMSNGSMWMPKGTAWWPDGGFVKEPGVTTRLDGGLR